MASLIGRNFRILCMAVLLLTVLPLGSVLAAPYAAYVMDARTGEVLYSRNSETRLHPASLTKMMTLYIAFEEISRGRLSLDSVVTVSKHAASQPPSRLGLKPGQKIALRYLIRAAAIKSANDAATAIGEHIAGGSEAAFAKRMTRTAKAIGMKSTTFRNANGLTAEGHLSTARDMSVLGRRIFYDFPQFYNVFSRRTADAGMAEVRNTNTRFLDAYKGADGIKTGYTVPAGFNLTASAERNGKRIIATVFGGTSTAQRNAKMAELMDIGFAEAPARVREKKPEAPVYDAMADDEALIASSDAAAIDAALAEASTDASGIPAGSAKTIRVSGSVTKSLRPKGRPGAAPVEAAAPEVMLAEAAPAEAVMTDDVAAAIAAGVQVAMAEATAAPPPEGSFEAQALALGAAEQPAPAAETLTAQAEVLAAPEGSLEAQAAALATGTPAVTAAEPELASAWIESTTRPKSRPAAPAPAEVIVAAAEPAPVVEPVVEAASAPEVLEQVAVAEPAPDTLQAQALAMNTPAAATVDPLADVTAVEEVAGATNAAPAPVALAAAIQPAKRRAPIFETVEPAAEPEVAEAEPEVVVRVSTSGERQFSVNVGSYNSRYEAERAMVKTALAESATLNGGQSKVIQKGGSYHATFMGLTENQAALACRRLKARAIECETVG